MHDLVYKLLIGIYVYKLFQWFYYLLHLADAESWLHKITYFNKLHRIFHLLMFILVYVVLSTSKEDEMTNSSTQNKRTPQFDICRKKKNKGIK